MFLYASKLPKHSKKKFVSIKMKMQRNCSSILGKTKDELKKVEYMPHAPGCDVLHAEVFRNGASIGA
jgi:hypothetical protein